MAGVFHQCGKSIYKRTRDEMDDRARIIARALAEQGVCDNDVVAILMRNHVDIFEIVEACRYVGSRYVLLNWHSPVAELLPILDDCSAKVLFAHRDLLKGENDRQTLLQVSTLSVIYTIKTPESTLERYHLTDNSLLASEAKTGEQYQCLDRLLAAPNATRHDEPPKRFKGMFPYTSGSTGKPKGIKRDEDLTRPDPYLIFKGLSEALMQLSIGDRFFVSAPLYHSAPHALTLCCLAARNIDVYIDPQFDPERFLQDIERFKLTHAYIVPTMMVRLLKLPESIRSKYDTSSLRFALSTGSALPSDVKEAMINWFGPIFYESYGASELGFMTLISSQEALEKPNSVGKPIPGAAIKILSDDKEECEVGGVGVIYAHLSMFAPFKYTNTTGTQSDLHVGEFTTLGDMGYVDEDGYLYICDRKKDMIISGGANIFPAEIESVIIEMPEVADCAVFGVPDAEYGEKVVVAVQCSPDNALSIDALHGYLDGKLARFKWPKMLQILDTLPREDTGKIFKNKLRAHFGQ